MKPTRTRTGALITSLALLLAMIGFGALPALAATASVSPTTATIAEGGSVDVTVTPLSAPTTDVTITVTSPDDTQVTVSPASFVVAAGTTAAHTVTITAVDDAIDEVNLDYTIAIASSNTTEIADPADVVVTVTDNDIRGITVSAISGDTTEAGGTATFTVVLDSEPTADVTIGVSSSDTGEGTVSANSLTFTPGDWDTSQTVTVTGVDDFVDDGDQSYSVTLAAAAGGDYTGIDPADIDVTNIDDDTDGMTVSAISGDTTEAGGTATFTVVLDAQPTVDVAVAVTSSDPSEGTVSPTAWTFTAGNWNTPQTVTVTGVDDFVDDGDIAYDVTVTTDGPYDPVTIEVVNRDNDDPLPPPPTACPSTIPDAGFGDLDGLTDEITHAIDCLAAYGISEGTAPDTFAPTVTVPRWQMALFLARTITALGAELPAPVDHGLTDIDDLMLEARNAIDRLVTLGVAKGTSETTFDPHGPVERWQMALFLARLADVTGVMLPVPDGSLVFEDLGDYGVEVRDAVQRLAAAGIAQGTSATTFAPSLGVARWQMALFLTRLLTEAGVTFE